MNASPKRKPRRPSLPYPALWLGLGCFALGIADTWLLLALGLEFSAAGKDGTLLIGSFLALSFGMFGWLWGTAIAARQRERRTADERRDALLRLAEAQARVARLEKMAALGQMVAAVAHEVRNPLAIVRTMVQNLGEELATGSPPDPRDVDTILAEIDRLARVVTGIGQIARPLRPKNEPVAAAEIAERLDFLTRTLYQDRSNPILTVTHPTDGIVFHGDADLICQALMTLVVNAAEANPPGRPVELHFTAKGDRIDFEVRDHGPGIAEDLRERVLEPFFTTKAEGNGLGLAIVHHIATALGGALCIGDAAGGGACLTLSLPRDPNSGGCRERVD